MEDKQTWKRILNYPWDRKCRKEVKRGCRRPHKIGMIYIQMPSEMIGKEFDVFLKEVDNN